MTAASRPARAQPRREGPEKARGEALYTADRLPPNVLYAAYVTAVPASGRVASVTLSPGPDEARLVSCLDAPRLKPAPAGAQALLLQDEFIFYSGQPIAAVLASSRAAARAAADRVVVRCMDATCPVTRMDQCTSEGVAPDILRCHEVEILAAGQARAPTDRYPTAAAPGTSFRPADAILFQPADSQRGDFEAAQRSAAHRVSETYSTAINNHLPIELHSALAEWDAGKLTITTATQAVQGAQQALAMAFGVDSSAVTVRSPLVGGGFGSKARAWFPSIVTAALLARVVGRPVFLELTRAQTFSAAGCRAPTIQALDLGCDKDGKLVAIRHRATAGCSEYGTYSDPHAFLSRSLYACPNVSVSHRLVHLNMIEPISMRAPGEATGSFALETAIDELAHRAAIDPVDFRLRNLALTHDPQTHKRWTSNHFDWCLREGAQRFGWYTRSRSRRDGPLLRGQGMAAATYPGFRLPASCRATLRSDGRIEVATAVHEIGNGLNTAFAQIAAEALGIALDGIVLRWGDSALPSAPPTVGSMTTASVGPVVQSACRNLRDLILDRARADRASALFGASTSSMLIKDGFVVVGHLREPLAALAARAGAPLEAEDKVTPDQSAEAPATQAFGTHFVEVAIDPDTGITRVLRIVSAFDVGRAVNPLLLKSQLLGGIVFGLGMALLEETALDPRLGRVLGASLADYHIPVQADVPEIEILIADKADQEATPFGAKTAGMMGVVGLAAAVGNAIFDATGRRVRSTPFLAERVLA
jgi:xanthine dehydrogenase YagR molybdenum-binding subunit